MSRSTILSLSILLAAGCGTSLHTTQLNAPPRAMQPRQPESVEVFTSGAPPRPHVDVALIEAEEQSSLSVADTADMLHKLRERGADMGCDAVVLGGASSRDPGVRDLESWVAENPKGRKGFYGTCIVYSGPPASASTSAPAPR
ncbi:MAG TPA: hypothetical protein VK698_38950 [Kofleriaceae bacterium]|nr:hypothetical protein [Kofleriaceae bacterium]